MTEAWCVLNNSVTLMNSKQAPVRSLSAPLVFMAFLIVHVLNEIDASAASLIFHTDSGAGEWANAGNWFMQSNGQGTSSIVIAPQAAFAITGSERKRFQQGRIVNKGSATWSGTGSLDMTAGSVFSNEGDLQILNDAAVAWFGGSPLPLFSNSGTLRKIAGIGITVFEVAFENAGTLRREAGVIEFGNSFTQTGGETVPLGGVIRSQKLMEFQGGRLSGPGTIQGSITMNGVLALEGGGEPLNVSGDYQQTVAGTFELRNFGSNSRIALNVAGKANLAGGFAFFASPGFQPADGARFSVASFLTGSGSFARLHGLYLGKGLTLHPELSATTLDLVASVQPLTRPQVSFDLGSNRSELRLVFPSIPGQPYRIEASDDLVHWETVFSGESSEATTSFAVPLGSSSHPYRFFRTNQD